MTNQDHWSASNYAKHASFVPKLGSIILDMLDPQPNEHVLDFGCGDGILTEKLATRCQKVTGIDASQDMIHSAVEQQKASNIGYHVVDGYDLDTWFNQQKLSHYDAVFSNATLHWLKKDPVKAIRNIHQVLKPQGRFVAEMGGFMNVGEMHSALIAGLNKRGFDGQAISPWYFPSDEAYTKLLEENGFRVVEAQLVPRMTVLNTDIAGWIETFGFEFLKPLATEQERKQLAQEVQNYLQPCYQRQDGKWVVMYVRLRVIATKN
ncbi:S-adenosyl-L-methionine-dependent methyltransferase [Gilbertella persicaria]|uniref:S-adenosyl-L-methionine-dependent methyltransferase n=1 Tax=Gilbertella persicaria TaxID=101096 RepID=UPI00221F693F|nr:S-adenosyl-L-methionine-dependent methyltransferase [Gilbertella persicaria]KAI8051897.1 S-adenosyl-L-methionine-dependent methyltransferase [Gilbertella persicaria]